MSRTSCEQVCRPPQTADRRTSSAKWVGGLERWHRQFEGRERRGKLSISVTDPTFPNGTSLREEEERWFVYPAAATMPLNPSFSVSRIVLSAVSDPGPRKRFVFSSAAVQGSVKRLLPGCVNLSWKYCVQSQSLQANSCSL